MLIQQQYLWVRGQQCIITQITKTEYMGFLMMIFRGIGFTILGTFFIIDVILLFIAVLMIDLFRLIRNLFNNKKQYDSDDKAKGSESEILSSKSD